MEEWVWEHPWWEVCSTQWQLVAVGMFAVFGWARASRVSAHKGCRGKPVV